MSRDGFFTKGFIYLSFLCLSVYGVTNWGRTFSASLFLAQLLGIAMLGSIVFLCLKAKVWGAILLFVLMIASTLCFVIDLVCYVIFDTPMTSAMIFTALETNLSEALSFVGMYWAKMVIALGLFGFFLVFFLGILQVSFIKRGIFLKILKIFAWLGAPILIYQCYFFFNKADCRFNQVLSFVLPFRYGCETYGALQEISNAKKAFLNHQITFKESVYPPPIRGH